MYILNIEFIFPALITEATEWNGTLITPLDKAYERPAEAKADDTLGDTEEMEESEISEEMETVEQ